MTTLRLLTTGAAVNGNGGEVFACTYSLDSAFVLTGGWDGQLRLWESSTGTQVTAFRAAGKPISACAVSADGKQWLSGSLDGMLANWDGLSHRQASNFLAHTRPISAIVYAPDGQLLATASWDCNLILWSTGRAREGRTLSGHKDIVAGCSFTPDGRFLASWSYDGAVRLWDVARARLGTELKGHEDRVTAGAVSPDGRWLVSGARDGVVKLWDLQKDREAASRKLGAEIKACFFLLDGESLVTVDAHGRMGIVAVPDLAEQAHLITRLPVQCAQLAPGGDQIALGCADGLLHLVAIDGIEQAPLVVTATQTSKVTATRLQRLFGRSQTTHAYSGTCPACRQAFELDAAETGQSTPCPHCCRPLRFGTVMQGVS